MKPAEQRSVDEQASLQRSNHLTDELLAADVLVMAAPMYNFAIPSTLKAWLDHVLRAGVTFKYTATGPQGLLTGKRAFVLTARGGIYTRRSSTRSPGTLPAPGHGVLSGSTM
jgi:FMN-dependent NADH-azoreductase